MGKRVRNTPKRVLKSGKKALQIKDYEKLIHAVKNYEQRIKEIEGSMYWKSYQFFTKSKLILTSDSYLKSDKWRFFQRLRFLVSRPGILLIRKFVVQLSNLFFGKILKWFKPKTKEEISDYETFKLKNFPRTNDLLEMKANIEHLVTKPSYLVLAFINSTNFSYLNQFLDGLERQVYEKYRVCFITDNPSDKITFTLSKVVKNDEVYQIVEYENLIKTIAEQQLDYCIITDISAIPTPDAFYQYTRRINKVDNVCFMYADHDFAESNQLYESRNPYFKPDFSPHTLWSRNYIGNQFLVSSALILKTKLPESPNLYALILSATSTNKGIVHIPKILSHQIEVEIDVNIISENHFYLSEFLASKWPNASAVLSGESAGCFEPKIPLVGSEPLISIVIPCKNKPEVLEVCLNAIFDKSIYKNFEVIIVDNGSTEKSFFSTVALWEYNYPTRVRCISLDIPFNYSKLNNEAVKHANGAYVLFLNNDTELISDDLLGTLLQYAQLPEVALVGPKLLYPNNTIQHAGIVLSIDETGAHVYSGAYKDTAGYFNNVNSLTNYSAVTGACMLIEKSKFLEVKGFDETLAVDCNDVELCCKLLEKGYYNLYVPQVKMIHYECLTRGNPMLTKRSMLRQQQEKIYFAEKWSKMLENDPFYNPNLSQKSKYYEIKTT